MVVAASALGMMAVANPAASAAPALTATPSTDLVDGQTVTATISGFRADTIVFVTECAMVAPNTLACDAANVVQVTTDATGAATTPVTARKVFEGVLADGTPYGPVDCAGGGCLVAAGDVDQVDGALAPISFQ